MLEALVEWWLIEIIDWVFGVFLGTSSSFKSYSKWGVDNSAAAESPGLLAPASSLKQGSVMDILGDYKGKCKLIFSTPFSTEIMVNTDLREEW